MPMSRRSLYRAPSRSRSPAPARSRKRARSASAARTSRNEDTNLTTQNVIRPRGGLSSPTFRFTRWADVSSIYNTVDGTFTGAIVSAVANDTIFQGFISLGNIPGVTDFQNLFSQYKIIGLEYHFINNIFTEVNGPNTGPGPAVGGCKNVAVYLGSQNDVLGVAAITQLQQESGVVVRTFANGGKPMIVKIAKPTYKGTAIDTTGATISSATDLDGWLDTQTAAAIPYRGFYLGIQSAFQASGSSATLMTLYSVRVKVSMIFRGVR